MNALDRQNPESLSTAGGSCSGRLWSRDRAIWRGNAARCVALLDRNIACKNVLTKSRRRRARSGQPTFTSKGYTIKGCTLGCPIFSKVRFSAYGVFLSCWKLYFMTKYPI